MSFQLPNYLKLIELWKEEFDSSEPKKKLILLNIASEVIINTQRMVSKYKKLLNKPEYQHYIRGFADLFQDLFKRNIPYLIFLKLSIKYN